MSQDFASVGQQFAKFYYEKFDSDRSQLAPLYRDFSMLTFEGQPFQGTQAIIEKLTSLSFQKVAHQVSSMDVQPSSDGKILVHVCGFLQVDGGENHLPYNQVFQLVPEGSTYYVLNDMFRLNLA
ncbi:nuclear transport factor 2 [Coprinellus micaceus]|uniref:Nuclear transport factor 2 n=1 Tax=Coprinellus micaceus TaxID=71717 RepID=A0A4Y7TPN5_COPMI|nr:nuclear transport factor 2 [Coprinellus micaceus]